jgi:thiol-disulfide isomerase/thioredoxin
MASAQRSAELLVPQGVEVAKAAMLESARKLVADFPNRPEPYQLLLNLTADGPAEQARATAQSMLSTNVPEVARESARQLLDRLDLLAKPLELKFTALDGRAVDLAALRGKVVLLDFWATWCVPCIVELPKVKAAYERLHADGFEIVGVSLDQEKETLTRFLEREKMPWPQYFDGKGWENQLTLRFGITSIPAMWLVDRKGMIRDMEAGENLADRAAKLLAEPVTAAPAP